jgi:hypothetical protein
MKKWTDEDEKELQELEALAAKSGASPNAQKWSDADERELQELEALAASQKPSELESMARGAVQGVSSGFSDEITGGVESLLTDKSYEQARDESRANNQAAQDANPGFYMGGEVAGGVGGLLTTGGTFAGVRGAAILGGLSGVGLSNKTGAELAQDGAIGAALGAGGEAVFKGIGNQVRGMFKQSSPVVTEAFEKLGQTTRPENAQFETSLIKAAALGKHGSADNFLTSDTAIDIANKQMDSMPQMVQDMLSDKMKELGVQQKSIIANVGDKRLNLFDNFVDDAGQVLPSPIDQLKESMKGFLNTGPKAKAVEFVKKNILDQMDNGKLKINDKPVDFNNLSFEDGQKVKQWISDMTFKHVDPLKMTDEAKVFEQAGEVSGALERFAGQIIELQNRQGGPALRAVNDQFHKLYNAKTLAPRTIDELLALTKRMGQDPKVTQGRLFLQSLEGISPEFRNNMVNELDSPIALWKMTSMANSAKSMGVSDLFRGKAAAGVIGPVGGLIAFGDKGLMLGAQALHRTGISDVARKAFKFPRSMGELVANADLSVSKISQFSPALAIALNDAIQDQNPEAISQVIQQLHQLPEAKAEFAPGVGFEGRVLSPEEGKALRSSLMSNAELPLREKVRMIGQLDKQGIIPVMPAKPPVLGVQRPTLDLATQNRKLVEKAEKKR